MKTYFHPEQLLHHPRSYLSRGQMREPQEVPERAARLVAAVRSLDFDVREVQVSRAIVENARRVVLVADSSKFARAAPVRIAHIAEVDVLVTDRLPPEGAELCRAHEVEVVEAGGPVEPDA